MMASLPYEEMTSSVAVGHLYVVVSKYERKAESHAKA